MGQLVGVGDHVDACDLTAVDIERPTAISRFCASR
jgi:hypothetical protein